MFSQDTKDHIWSHLNVFLLMLLLLVLVGVLVHTYHHAPDRANFVEQKVGEVLAGLLAILTAARIGNQRNGDDHAKTDVPPPDSPPAV